jgi:hypothetical protein
MLLLKYFIVTKQPLPSKFCRAPPPQNTNLPPMQYPPMAEIYPAKTGATNDQYQSEFCIFLFAELCH